jgi:hypothetical protein
VTLAQAREILREIEREIRAIRLARWEREWAGGRHQDAPPKPG